MYVKFPSLSKRAQPLAETPARVDFEIFMEAMHNLYCPIKNPNGAIPLNVAENKLMADKLRLKLNEITQTNDIPEWVMGYTDPIGNPEVRKVVANFMEEHLCHCPISEDSIGFSAGASAVIEASSFLITDPGDVVVIPAPSYPMYTHDLGVKNNIERYNLQTHYSIEEFGSIAPVNTKLLNNVLKELQTKNKNFKILLLTSPDNPTGIKYEKDHLERIANWCMENKIHLIVNEIYGLSTIDTSDTRIIKSYPSKTDYVSFAQIMLDRKSNYLHMWYAFSKDFASSGLRFGILHSLNEAMMKAFGNSNIPHMVSNLTQWVFGILLKDDEFIKNYLLENKSKLHKSYLLLINALKELNIPFVPIRGSFFVWADFSQFLINDSKEAENKLWLEIYRNTGVLLTPGTGFEHQKNGLFRIVFSAVKYDHLNVAIRRLQGYLNDRK